MTVSPMDAALLYTLNDEIMWRLETGEDSGIYYLMFVGGLWNSNGILRLNSPQRFPISLIRSHVN